MSKRLIISLIALLLLVALVLSYHANQRQVEHSPTWIEVYPPPQPRMSCTQGGKPPRVLVDVQLWPGGPGVRLMQEYQNHLGRMMQEYQKHLDLHREKVLSED